MVSTHARVDISGTNSRVGTGRPFMELIKEAISSWPDSYTTEEVNYFGKQIEVERITPHSWEDLCIEGQVQVFLLVDKSNQVTDLTDTRETVEDVDSEGNLSTQVVEVPKLYYAMSLFRSNENDNWLTATLESPVQFRREDEGLVGFRYQVPRLPLMGIEEASQLIYLGGAVVGFNPETPDKTIKFYSREYDRKWNISNGDFNPIHRWHVLMDQSPSDAAEYLDYTPLHQKKYTMKEMNEINLQYLNETSSYLGGVVLARIQGQDTPLPPKLYNYTLEDSYKISNLIGDNIRKHRKNSSLNDIEADIAKYVASLPYTKQHSLHGQIAKTKAGYL
jgi:hypothetical protein